MKKYKTKRMRMTKQSYANETSRCLRRHLQFSWYSANTYETQHNMTICGGYPYTTGTQKAAKISNKNSFFNWVHSLHKELINASHSTNLFTNSCDHIFTNGKAPLHSHINHNNPQFLYSLWRRANARSVSFLNLPRW